MKPIIMLLIASALSAPTLAAVRPKLAGPVTVELIPYGPGAKPVTFQVSSVEFDIEQTLNIGSQSTGAGAGKISFHPLSFKKNVDAASARIFEAACSGTPFQQVNIKAGSFAYTLKLAAVKTDGYTIDSVGNVVETVTLEYGGATITDGSSKAGWDRVKNVKLTE